jgi:Copper amine oxidase N-terminal domain.
MKKIVSMLAAFAVMFGASSAYADTSIKLQMNNRTDGVLLEVKSDAAPELKNNRVMVPIRVISEQLGAKAWWTGKEAMFVKGGTTVILRPDSDTALVNGKPVKLDAEPYLKNNRVMVPLRFVSEVFGCDVSYENHTVTVETKPFAVDGINVAAFQIETNATLGSVVQHVLGNSYIEAFYHAIEAGVVEEVEPPASTAPKFMLAGPDDWYTVEIYDFLDQDGNSIRHYELYSQTRDSNEPELEFHLLYAAHEDQWYKFERDGFFEILDLIQAARLHGYGLVVENSAP